MLEQFFPDLILNEISEIDANTLKQKGYRLLIFDIDNTLVAYHEKDATEKVNAIIGFLRAKGFQTALVSNNNRERVDRFNKDLKLFSVPRAMKPFKRGMRKVMKHFSVAPQETVLCGDQILTDIFGGNRLGLYTILVTPIEINESGFFRMKRRIEAYILKKMKERDQSIHESK